MRELLMIAVGAAFINNVVLSQFLGLCPSWGCPRRLERLPVWVEQSSLSLPLPPCLPA